MRRQDKEEEIRKHLEKLSVEKEHYESSGWGPEKIGRALSFLYSFIDSGRNYKVLDLGCGGMTLTKDLIKHRNLSIVSLDLVFEVLSHISTKRMPGLPFVAADAESMPFADRSFDLVVHNQTLHHFPTLSWVLKEIYRVLKPNGMLFSIETNGWNPYVIYGHKAPWKKRQRFISTNQKLFGYPTFKAALQEAHFEVLGKKMVNFDVISILKPLEGFFEKIPLLNVCAGGSMVVCSQKRDAGISKSPRATYLKKGIDPHVEAPRPR